MKKESNSPLSELAKLSKFHNTRLIQPITTKAIPLEGRQAQFILSTNVLDRAGDSINPLGIDLRRYKQNPVVLWGHDQHCLPIGKCVSIGVEGGALTGIVEFVPVSVPEVGERAEAVYQLVRSGFLNAVSIGFKPIEWTFNDAGGLDISKSELLEFSVVAVPCNPDALLIDASTGMTAAPGKSDQSIIRKTNAARRERILALIQ